MCGPKDNNREESIWETVNLIQKHTLLFSPHNHPPSLPLTPRPPPGVSHALFGEVIPCVTILGQKLRLRVFRPFPILEQELRIRLGPLLPEGAVSFFGFCAQIYVSSFCVSLCFVSSVWRFGFPGLVWFGGGLSWRHFLFGFVLCFVSALSEVKTYF